MLRAPKRPTPRPADFELSGGASRAFAQCLGATWSICQVVQTCLGFEHLGRLSVQHLGRPILDYLVRSAAA